MRGRDTEFDVAVGYVRLLVVEQRVLHNLASDGGEGTVTANYDVSLVCHLLATLTAK